MITGNEPINPILGQPIIYEMPDGTKRVDTGLTIRQHFAAMAMQEIVTNYELSYTAPDCIEGLYQQVAYESVKMADALIDELNKTKS